MIRLHEVIGDYDGFLENILLRVADEGFDFADFVQIDHVCYRTVSIEEYSKKKTELSKIARLLGETMVNERPIATFRLNKPIRHGRWRVDAVELAAPKAGARHSEGLQHLEFVLYDDIPTFLEKYRHKLFKLKAVDRGINPDVSLALDDFAVKFHLLSLPTVVYLEQKLGITSVSD